MNATQESICTSTKAPAKTPLPSAPSALASNGADIKLSPIPAYVMPAEPMNTANLGGILNRMIAPEVLRRSASWSRGPA
jgi:hypothetical protein